MNRQQRLVILAGMVLTFWFGFISGSEDYRRYLLATLTLTAGGLLFFHGTVGTPGGARRAAAAVYRSRAVRLVLVALLVGPLAGVVGSALLGYRAARKAAAIDAVEHAFREELVRARAGPKGEGAWLISLRRVDKAVTDRALALQALDAPVSPAALSTWENILYILAFTEVSSACQADLDRESREMRDELKARAEEAYKRAMTDAATKPTKRGRDTAAVPAETARREALAVFDALAPLSEPQTKESPHFPQLVAPGARPEPPKPQADIPKT